MRLYILIICCVFLCISANSQSIKKIKAIDASEIINNRDTTSTVLIDGRSDDMFAERHIDGALNIDAFGSSLSDKLKNYLENNEIIVYCTNHRRAEIIIEKLKELHYNSKIIFITDGINGWISAGYETIGT